MTDVLDGSFSVEVDPLYEEAVELPVERQYGGLAWKMTDDELSKIGARVLADYEDDESARGDWLEQAKKALDRASQEKAEAKNYPWPNASNVSFPLLTVAALQFHARAYPAIVKNDEAVSVKVFGQAAQMDPQAQALAEQKPETPEQEAMVRQARAMVQQYMQAAMARKFKLRRSKRVAEYLNYTLFYGMPDWEGDTDSLLLQLPIIGAAFRKTYRDPDTNKVRASYVTALNVVVPQSATSLQTTPRVTEILNEVFPYQIQSRMLTGFYCEHRLVPDGDDSQGPRRLLEQHRYEDLDGDGLDEPYVVTVDYETGKVLRIEQSWTEQQTAEDETVIGHTRFMPYTLYGFIPDPKGRFYPIGFGHLLDAISDVVNTVINQLVDAGHAQIAGGGFVASGLRLQGAGNTNVLRWRPGEYKSVQASGGQLRDSIYERTFPAPSAVAFQMLELMLGAAREVTSTSDVITGQAPASAPVGTTLALIDQGLQVFTAIYKRVYRSLKAEFKLLYDMQAVFGDPQEYMDVVDDPEANLERDFSQAGNDVVPVSDPTVATKMQSMAKAQFLLGMTGKGLNDREIYLRAFRAADIDDAEELAPAPQPQPGAEEAQALGKANAEAEISKKKASAIKDVAAAQKTMQEARQTALENGITQAEIDAYYGGLQGLEVQPGNGMGPVDPAAGF